ncbi:MAG TPA: Rieske (2Fe-2S) protein [Steroidobacteraceae bacterium]|nr:Rieske (2Fe-2S) protein [Steroidobacteraceae bacterium]
MTREVDLTRVICALKDLAEGECRGFSLGAGDWPLAGLIVRVRSEVRAYINRCPHAGHPLNLIPNRFLTPDGALLLCHSHGALFDKQTGECIAGPCAGQALQSLPLQIEGGFVLLDAGYALP